ncbi:MAG: hydantoinase B/oxoprolinase family protein, partial [Dehalococcoidia bacterium]
MSSHTKRIDPITLEVIRNRLDSIVREMGDITLRTARSAVVYKGRDFSCGLFNRDAELLAIGTGVPVHIFPMVWQVRNTLARFVDDVEPGDIFIGNDPHDGGTHLNDVLIFIPVFYTDELVGFACNRAHWYDVGGMVPGSLSGSAREIYQEGLRIPPIRFGRRDRLDPNVLDLVLRNVRVPSEVMGDIWAQVASCRVGSKRITEMMDQYGKDTVIDHWAETLDASERRMRALVSQLPQTTVVHEGYLDNDGVRPDRCRIRVTVTTKGDSI